MNHRYFTCCFLSDIVLPSTANTEGNVGRLDFVPGSNFLGMVARFYPDFGVDAFTVFHGGSVRFGDASPLLGNERGYRMPSCFFAPKGMDFEEALQAGTLVNHHCIETFDPAVQLKQMRTGHVTPSGALIEAKYRYSQKSAYDRDKRRSRDEMMFGYSALSKGSAFGFEVTFDGVNTELEERVVATLLGEQRLGKSRSAQYGRVVIVEREMPSGFEHGTVMEDEPLILYADSRLALFDAQGMPTLRPEPEHLGISSGRVIWEKTQIRTALYTPYNGARQTKDYARAVIEKGSIIVLEGVAPVDAEKLKQGVGAFLSEGFGRLLLNPAFAQGQHPAFETGVPDSAETMPSEETLGEDSDLLKWLRAKRREEMAYYDTVAGVDALVKEHGGRFTKVSRSQWGAIRKISARETDATIYDAVEGFISHGVAKKQWEKGRDALFEAVGKGTLFASLLARRMYPLSKKEEQHEEEENNA